MKHWKRLPFTPEEIQADKIGDLALFQLQLDFTDAIATASGFHLATVDRHFDQAVAVR